MLYLIYNGLFSFSLIIFTIIYQIMTSIYFYNCNYNKRHNHNNNHNNNNNNLQYQYGYDINSIIILLLIWATYQSIYNGIQFYYQIRKHYNIFNNNLKKNNLKKDDLKKNNSLKIIEIVENDDNNGNNNDGNNNDDNNNDNNDEFEMNTINDRLDNIEYTINSDTGIGLEICYIMLIALHYIFATIMFIVHSILLYFKYEMNEEIKSLYILIIMIKIYNICYIIRTILYITGKMISIIYENYKHEKLKMMNTNNIINETI